MFLTEKTTHSPLNCFPLLQVVWGSALSEYEEWFCGMKGDEMEKKLCRGACVTTTMLKDDYFSVIKNIDPPGKLR